MHRAKARNEAVWRVGNRVAAGYGFWEGFRSQSYITGLASNKTNCSATRAVRVRHPPS